MDVDREADLEQLRDSCQSTCQWNSSAARRRRDGCLRSARGLAERCSNTSSARRGESTATRASCAPGQSPARLEMERVDVPGLERHGHRPRRARAGCPRRATPPVRCSGGRGSARGRPDRRRRERARSRASTRARAARSYRLRRLDESAGREGRRVHEHDRAVGRLDDRASAKAERVQGQELGTVFRQRGQRCVTQRLAVARDLRIVACRVLVDLRDRRAGDDVVELVEAERSQTPVISSRG